MLRNWNLHRGYPLKNRVDQCRQQIDHATLSQKSFWSVDYTSVTWPKWWSVFLSRAITDRSLNFIPRLDVDISRGRNYVLQTKQKFPILDEAADVFRGLLPFIPTQQRLQFKHIFPALETIIEETLQHQLMPKWSLLPKKTLREFRSMNQIAITPCFQY